MRSLFLKIYFWFWVANSLLIMVLLASIITTESEPLTVRWREITNSTLTLYARTAVDVLEERGPGELNDYLSRLEKDSASGASIIRANLLDKEGRDLTGRTLIEGATELAARAIASNQAEIYYSRIRSLAARSVLDSHGQRFVLVLEIPGGPFRPFRPPFRVFASRILLVLLTAAIVCYWLARYLAAPVIKLREATRQLAAGNLSARVGTTGRRSDEIVEVGRDFDQMAERIEGLVTAQQRLLGDVSHELRSPLARLSVALELARTKAGPESAPALDRIEREAGRLNDLIGQLLTLSKLESGVQDATRQQVDLAWLVRGIATDADFEARSRNCSVRILQLEDSTTSGSQEFLRRGIENVIRNAVRYTQEQTEVEVSLRRETADQALITIRDHGRGVPEATLHDLFRPFYRVADARDRQTGGIGLGLAISDRAVRWHGGTITAANHPDGGLVVEIRLPLSK